MANFCLILCVLAASWAIVAAEHQGNSPAQPPAAAPGSGDVNCTGLIYNMVDCVPYVAVGGSDEVPEPLCCNGLKEVVETDVDCVCEALKSTADLGIDVNMTSAEGVVSACGLSASPISACNRK
ncbi:unnamed protein product [Thlaspi arvense]|uniref:Bifunctional inhibitor/plant lipid transfer protein/seed storage helical domain-containing protein n=1 Tax=Thlaspi arvense TaxID=13288 RepID=A0AAU9SZW4_THLAR|nr:unnamed protein product [Thlaspi arvense]